MSDLRARANCSQSLLSTAHQQMLDTLIQHHGIRQYFQKIIGLENHYAKSKLEAGQVWMNELQYNPDDVLLIGDTTHDYEVAQDIGLNCILISHGHNSYSRLAETGVQVFDNFSCVEKWLLEHVDDFK